MFRRMEDTIGPDPVYPADLKDLGFFVNNLGHIRMIEAPDKEYIFHATNNERVNEMRREAMQECSRQETEKRLSALGIDRIYLPEFTTTKPNGPHVPILAPSPEILKNRKRVIVLINDSIQDLGILAYRQMQRELGLNGASVVNFVKELVKRSPNEDVAKKYREIFEDRFELHDNADTPALVVMNTGQLLYSHKQNKAMTLRSWSALPRKSIAHDMVKIHNVENRIQGHRNPREHIKSVFDSVLCNPDRVAPDAELYVIAIEGGSEYLLSILGDEFQKYGSRITAMALVHSLTDDCQIKDPNLRAFLRQRTREWRHSTLVDDPQYCVELPRDYSPQFATTDMKMTEQIAWNEDLVKPDLSSTISNAFHRLVISATPPDKTEPTSTTSEMEMDTETDWSFGHAALCPTFAGGPESTGECIFTNEAVRHAILSFFEEVAQDPENYQNPRFHLYTNAPQPTPDSPLELDVDRRDAFDFSSLPPEMTPEQGELYFEKETLEQMKLALKACPDNVAELQQGRQKLTERIANQEVKIEKLKTKILATGGLKAGEASEQRENWKPQKEGKKVKFAGVEVDSELLKAAGLLDTAEEELQKLEEDCARS